MMGGGRKKEINQKGMQKGFAKPLKDPKFKESVEEVKVQMPARNIGQKSNASPFGGLGAQTPFPGGKRKERAEQKAEHYFFLVMWLTRHI